jgi:hypothetical protein
MVITFKSAAAGDVMMLSDHAERLLGIIGKEPKSTQGIVTVEQLSGAIDKLLDAIAEDKARQAEANADPDQEEKDKEEGRVGMAAPVGLAQRAWPLLDMLQCSLKEQVPVVWGV